MTKPVLYVGVAAPLVEKARVWFLQIPDDWDAKKVEAQCKDFPYLSTGAYNISLEKNSLISFRTSTRVNEERVIAEIEKWSGATPKLLGDGIFRPIPGIDHENALRGLWKSLQEQEIQIASRIGLTLQNLQEDICALQPDVALISCHGTAEGFLLFEDGRGCADYVMGERFLGVVTPMPQVLFINACHSGAFIQPILNRESLKNSSIIYVQSETAIEVGASVKFELMLFQSILQGMSVEEAFSKAQIYVSNDSTFGNLSADPKEVPPSKKFVLQSNKPSTKLSLTSKRLEVSKENEIPKAINPVYYEIKRSKDRFVGRKREMSQAIDRLLPLPVGTHRFSESGEHRLVTLTKEGGIGKTGLACQVTDWACERGLFPGGVVGIGCEQFINGQQLVSQLLTLLGLPPESQNGDPLDMLKVILPQIIQSQPSLFILDNLDQLIGRHIAPETSDYTDKFLQTLLNISPEIRVLATSRSPLGLGDHEFDLEVPPMDIEEAKDVFVSYLDSPIHRLEVEKLWEQPKSLIHELVEMSGYHPLSLKLLAFQMKRPGLSFEKLLSEAKSDLMDVLTDPYSSDEDKNRLRKVRNSYELSYKNLSGEGKRLFERMSFFPGGVFTGGPVDLWIKWDELLGENWREIMERELDYFGLVHYEPDGHHGNLGSFIMLNPMLEFAKSKYSQERNETWEKDWTKFWQERIELWDAILSGKLPSDLPGDFDQKKEMAVFLRQIAKLIFAKTQLNWLKNFDHCLNLKSNLTKDLLLHTVDFCSLSGQLTLLRTLSEKTVQLFRDTADEANLAPCLGTLGNVLGDLGDLDEAHTSYEEALNLYRKFAKQHPKTFEPFVGNTLNNLGVVLDGLGDPNEACTAYGEALEIRRKFAKQAPEAYEPGVAMTLNNLGVVLRDLGDPSGARTAYQEALDLYRKFAEQHPEAYEPDVAMTLNNLGILRRELGDPNGARTAFQEALDLYRKFAKQHPEAYEPDVAMTLDNLGIVLSDSGDSSGARAAFEVALEIRRKFAKQHPAAYEPAFASTFNNLGNVLRDLGDRDGARAAFEEAMRILSPFFERLPQAFVGDFVIFLRNYISITKETPDDLWWNLWKELQEKAKVEEMAQAETE